MLADNRDRRITCFLERRSDAAACFTRTAHWNVSYYEDTPVPGAEVGRAVGALAVWLRQREAAFAPGAIDAAFRRGPRLRTGIGRAVELRVNRECNEACVFCNTPEASPTITEDRLHVLRAIDRGREAGYDAITLSGREATLCPHLVAYVERARERGYGTIGLQTNATAFAAGPLLGRLVEAGLTSVEVSLHTFDPDTFERLVGAAPRLLDATLRGIARIASYPDVRVTLVHVLTRLNVDTLPALVDRVGREMPHVKEITVSLMAPVGDGARRVDLVPALARVRAPLAQAFEVATGHGVILQVPSRCGMPLCVMPPGTEAHNAESQNAPGHTLEPGKAKGAPCAACVHEPICTGVWKPSLAVHGEADLVPVTP